MKLKSFVKGKQDNQVKTIQRILNELGYKRKDGKKLTVEGHLENNTEFAIIAFQKAKGVKVSYPGTVGGKTWTGLLNAS